MMWLWFSVFDEHVRRSKVGGGNSREMDFESFLDFVLALENKDTAEGLTYLFRCLDLNGRGFLTTADIHSLFRYVWTNTVYCYFILMTAVLCALMIDMLVQFEPLWLPFWPIGLSWFLKATQNLLLSDVFLINFFVRNCHAYK